MYTFYCTIWADLDGRTVFQHNIKILAESAEEAKLKIADKSEEIFPEAKKYINQGGRIQSQKYDD